MEVADCITCHNHHDIGKPSDAMLGIGQGSMCVSCHSEGDAGYIAASTMSSGIERLKASLSSAHDLLNRASRGGVNVSLGQFDLHSADDALIKARTAVHYFDTTKLNDVVQAGLTDAGRVIDLGNTALDDLRMRRVGLAFSLPLILLVALGLIWKIRQLEQKN